MMEPDPDNMLFGALSPEDTDDVLTIVARILTARPQGGASDWTLQKTYFLACVESIEDRLTLLPGPRFFSWKHGPWSKDLRQLVEMAAEVGDLDIDLVSSKYRGSTEVYRLPRKRKLEPMRDSDNEAFLEDFLGRFSSLSGEKLTELAKETVPFQRTPLGHPIDLGTYLTERRAALERLSNDQKLADLLASRTR